MKEYERLARKVEEHIAMVNRDVRREGVDL